MKRLSIIATLPAMAAPSFEALAVYEFAEAPAAGKPQGGQERAAGAAGRAFGSGVS
ncbi:hypothetical protein IM543_18205 [Massilia sp. UMI-21]|nr:hypothetical protein IM543_18205 [Massilia sp. UMI-21]